MYLSQLYKTGGNNGLLESEMCCSATHILSYFVKNLKSELHTILLKSTRGSCRLLLYLGRKQRQKPNQDVTNPHLAKVHIKQHTNNL